MLSCNNNYGKNFWILIFISSIFLYGCMSSVNVETINTYQLITTNKINNSRSINKILMIADPSVNPGYNTDQMIYVEEKNPLALKAFSRNRWVASPARMLMTNMIENFQATKTARAIVSPAYSGMSDVKLDTQLIQFQQEFFSHQSQAHITIRAALINQQNNQIIASKRFDVVVPCQPNPQDGVRAMNVAMSLLMQELREFLVKNA